jgi:hypothetical protein
VPDEPLRPQIERRRQQRAQHDDGNQIGKNLRDVFQGPAILAKTLACSTKIPMRNVHVWKTTTEEGEKREVRAEKFGKKWRLQAKLKHDERWTYYDDPLLEDLIELRDVLFRKYQRKHLSYEDVAAVEKMITDRGGTWKDPNEDEPAED